MLHSPNTVYSGGRCIEEIYGLTADDVCFMASTLAHQTGFGYGLMTPLGQGMKVVYQDAWDADQMLDASAISVPSTSLSVAVRQFRPRLSKKQPTCWVPNSLRCGV